MFFFFLVLQQYCMWESMTTPPSKCKTKLLNSPFLYIVIRNRGTNSVGRWWFFNCLVQEKTVRRDSVLFGRGEGGWGAFGFLGWFLLYVLVQHFLSLSPCLLQRNLIIFNLKWFETTPHQKRSLVWISLLPLLDTKLTYHDKKL